MTFEDALAELGIEDDAAPDQARRAYLRLLKTRKPETDPQGFMRLREAYELLKPQLEWRAALQRPRAVAPELPVAPAPVVVPDPPPEPEPPARELAAEAPHEERAAAPELPAEDPPKDDGQDDEEEADDEDEPLAPAPRDVDALLAAGQHAEAAGALARFFDHAVERSEDATPAVPRALRLILLLYAKSSPTAAAALGASLFQYLRASGEEARAVRGADAARWTILRELAALSPAFPDTVRSAIARAAMVGDLGQATTELATLQARRPGPAAEAALLLRRRAPVIAAAVADTLDPPEPPGRRRADSAPTARSGWAIGVVAMILLRLVAFIGNQATTPSYTPSASRSYEPPSVAALLDAGRGPGTARVGGARGQLREQALTHADRVKAHADYALGSDAGRAAYAAVSEDAAEVERAVRGTSCFEARATAQAIELLFEPHGVLSGDARGRDEARALREAVGAYCKDLEAAPDGGAPQP